MHLVKLTFLSLLLVALASPRLAAQGFDFDGAGTAVAAQEAPTAGGGVPANLVGWWKLNDVSGTTAADSSGNGNTGSLNGTTWGATFLTFDGTGDYIEAANEINFDFQTNNAFSITAWIKLDSSATGSRIIVSKQQNFGNGPGIDFRARADNLDVACYIVQADGSSIALATTDTLTLNTWHSVAVTYDGSSANTGAKLYINGSEATDFRSGSLTQSILNDTPLLIGKGFGASEWYGDLDDVRVYDVELSAGQISALNSGGAQ
jgi:hypothetical protein